MEWIAKRKIRETWREAVGARFAAVSPEGLQHALDAFDTKLRDGASEVEAAYAVLADAGLLWQVDAPGLRSTRRPAEGSSPHTVPSV